jgi:hypothetical protein
MTTTEWAVRSEGIYAMLMRREYGEEIWHDVARVNSYHFNDQNTTAHDMALQMAHMLNVAGIKGATH